MIIPRLYKITATTIATGLFIANALSLRHANIVVAAQQALQQVNQTITQAQTPPTKANSPAASNTASAAPGAKSTEQHTDRTQSAVTSTQSSASPLASSPRPSRIGIFVSDSPSDPSSPGRLSAYAGLGVDTVFNYTALDGSVDQIRAYLDRAQSLNLKVIISLKDYYDALGPNNYKTVFSPPLGSNNESSAIAAAQLFGSHPAVWGFAITDEAPEAPSSLSYWRSVLEQRYRLLKAQTNKPIMSVLVGAVSSQASVRRQFLANLRGSSDTLALDYYPIPFQSTSMIRDIGADLLAVGDGNGWFIAQAFSWSSYPGTAANLGFSVAASRLPTSDEMLAMAQYALAGGARNILYYSYFDIANNPSQLTALRSAIARLR